MIPMLKIKEKTMPARAVPKPRQSHLLNLIILRTFCPKLRDPETSSGWQRLSAVSFKNGKVTKIAPSHALRETVRIKAVNKITKNKENIVLKLIGLGIGILIVDFVFAKIIILGYFSYIMYIYILYAIFKFCQLKIAVANKS